MRKSFTRNDPRAIDCRQRLRGLAVTLVLTASLAVAAAPQALAATGGGTVFGFGANGGSLGDGTTTNRNAPVAMHLANVIGIAAGGPAAALRADGTVWEAGNPSLEPVQVAGIDNVAAVSAGSFHRLVLRSDGTVWAWGQNLSGELGDGTTTDNPTPSKVAGLSSVVAIAAGTPGNCCPSPGIGYSLAIKSDGTLYGWGASPDRSSLVPHQIAMPSGSAMPVSLAAGGEYTQQPFALVRTADGKVYSWGDNTYGQLGLGPGVFVAVPTEVTGLAGKIVTAIAAGGTHAMALANDGTLWGWGSNLKSQVGNESVAGTTVPVLSFTPTQVPGISGVQAVAAGGQHTLAVTTDGVRPPGTVWAWGASSPAGANYFGQTGCHDNAGQSVCAGSGRPVPVQDPTDPSGLLTGVSSVAAGRFNSFALKASPAPSRRAVADFDGNGSTDVSVFRAGTWFVKDGLSVGWGADGDIPVPADYDGDGKTDVAIFRPSTGLWAIHNSGGGDSFVTYGIGTDIPVPADYDGDGKADLAIYRPEFGTWWMHRSSDNTDGAATFGITTDTPVPADYDGDGKTDLGIFRDGIWYVHPASGGADTARGYGSPGDVPVVGDYDGDGHADIAIFRPSTNLWSIHHSGDGTDEAFSFGIAGDVPVPGDYNADGRTDAATFTPSTGGWNVKGGLAAQWGIGSDIPLPLPYAVRAAYPH